LANLQLELRKQTLEGMKRYVEGGKKVRETISHVLGGKR